MHLMDWPKNAPEFEIDEYHWDINLEMVRVYALSELQASTTRPLVRKLKIIVFIKYRRSKINN